jgi:hypothetical protein
MKGEKMRMLMRLSIYRLRHFFEVLTGFGAILLCMAISATSVQAFRFDTGNPDLKLRWDNTIKYSTAMRAEKQTDELVSSINQDDCDRNFSRGMISNRVDLLSEMDVIYKGFGARVSAAAWYDTVYNESNNNDSPGTANAYSVPNDEFTDETRDLHGRDAEVLDAFLFGKQYVGDTTLSFRAGQYAMQWGESLFFGNNGVAGGMAPIDAVKALSVPNSQFKEIIRPVPQISAQAQIGSDFSIGAYYQLGWEATRTPGAGSYFSNLDFFGDGGERLYAGGPLMPGGENAAFYRGDDLEASDSGQGGIQIRYRIGEFDLGAYALNYHDKTPQLYAEQGGVDPLTGRVGEYYLVYAENIQLYGISTNTNVGLFNIGAELSYRCNTPLVSDLQMVTPGITADNDENPLYAVGDSFHAQLSWIASMEPNFISNESDFIGEIAFNRRTRITENSEALAGNTTKDAWGIKILYEPKFRQLFPGADVGVPIGLSYYPRGCSSVVSNFGVDKGGDMNIGLNITYVDVWKIGLAYTHYYGSSGTFLDDSNTFSFQQAYADKDFVSFSISRTF